MQHLRLRSAIGAVIAATLLAGVFAPAAMASSHREAPFISEHPKVDGTDFYMFRSYQAGRSSFTTLSANYGPLQDAYGGPNYFMMDPDALYEIHIDNNGDAKEDITFQFRFKNTNKDAQLTIGGKKVSIPLVINGGAIAELNAAAANVRETFSVTVVRGDRRSGARAQVANAAGGATVFDKPLDNIGSKAIPDYAAYAAGSRDWQTIRDAVYARLREHYRAQFAKLYDASNESAADLVRRMCAVTEKSHAAE